MHKKNWWRLVGKRKSRYSPESRTQHRRKYKKLAEEVVMLEAELDIPWWHLRKAFLLPYQYRKYMQSLRRNRAGKE